MKHYTPILLYFQDVKMSEKLRKVQIAKKSDNKN